MYSRVLRLGRSKKEVEILFEINFEDLICQAKEFILYLDSSGEIVEGFLSRRMKWRKWNLRKIDLVKVCRIGWLGGIRGGWMAWDTDASNVFRGNRNPQQSGYKNRKEGWRRETCQHSSLCMYTGQRESW